MLKTGITSGTGRAANIGVPCAGKTGTTDDYKDASFVGYTPTVVTGVWVGNDDNTTTKSIQGGTVPALIWRDVMKTAVEKFGKSDFDYPEIQLSPSGVTYQSPTEKSDTPDAKNSAEPSSENTEFTDVTTPPSSAPSRVPPTTYQLQQNSAPAPAATTPAAPKPSTPAAPTSAPVPMGGGR